MLLVKLCYLKKIQLIMLLQQQQLLTHYSRKKNHGLKCLQQKDKQNLQNKQLISRQLKKKMKEKIQQLMKMENIFKLQLKQRLKLLNFNKCWLQVKLLQNKRFYQINNEWPMNQLTIHQLSKKKMMVIWKQLRKLKLRWRLLKKQWMKELLEQKLKFNR